LFGNRSNPVKRRGLPLKEPGQDQKQQHDQDGQDCFAGEGDQEGQPHQAGRRKAGRAEALSGEHGNDKASVRQCQKDEEKFAPPRTPEEQGRRNEVRRGANPGEKAAFH
jgi:hypothetical protein